MLAPIVLTTEKEGQLITKQELAKSRETLKDSGGKMNYWVIEFESCGLFN